MATYSVNPELAKAFSRKYPRMASKLIESFIARELLKVHEVKKDEK